MGGSRRFWIGFCLAAGGLGLLTALLVRPRRRALRAASEDAGRRTLTPGLDLVIPAAAAGPPRARSGRPARGRGSVRVIVRGERSGPGAEPS